MDAIQRRLQKLQKELKPTPTTPATTIMQQPPLQEKPQPSPRSVDARTLDDVRRRLRAMQARLGKR
ncbi:MAG: hypothetical protein AABY13_03045 [Nanoarchaeota archaeon]